MSKKLLMLTGLLILIGGVIAPVEAQEPLPKFTLSLDVDAKSAKPGDIVNLVVTLDHPAEWKSYWINPGTGQATTFSWTVPEGYKVGEVLWPIPKKVDSYGSVTHAFTGKAHYIAPLTIPANAPTGDVSISLNAKWLACKVNCIPKKADAEVTLSISDSTVKNPSVEKLATKVTKSQPTYLSEWDIAVGGDDEKYELTLTPKDGANTAPKDVYFFEAAKNAKLDPNSFKVSNKGNQTVLTFDKKGVVGSKDIAGFIYASNGWLAGDAKTKAMALNEKGLVIDYSAKAEKKPLVVVEESNQSDVELGKKLYDVNAKPEYVLLSGKAEKKLTLIPAMGLVFIGGMLLNIMPCVFPVLALKIMGFVEQAGEDAGKVKKHGLMFGVGVVLSMWVLASFIIAFDLDWGAQMQNPLFVGVVILIMFLLGLNMAGVFEFGTSLTGVGGGLQQKKGYSGSFFSGILTTLIATPCSGPFLGAVMGFALSQNNKAISFIIFTIFALGIAFPYILLSFFPALIEKLPPPGKWMENFKKGMSFAMFATAVLFIRSFTNQTGADGLSLLLLALVVIGLGFWIFGTWGTLFIGKAKRFLIGYGLAFAVCLVGLYGIKRASDLKAPELAESSGGGHGGHAQQWYPGVLEVSRSKKRIAWIDYTADW